MLRRRNMELDSYSCENCIIIPREETLSHLLFKCSIMKRYWDMIGVTPPRAECPCSHKIDLRADK